MSCISLQLKLSSIGFFAILAARCYLLRPKCAFASFPCGNSSIGRASASQAEGRGFDSRFPLHRAVSSVGLERLPYKQEAGGSNPSPPTPLPIVLLHVLFTVRTGAIPCPGDPP